MKHPVLCVASGAALTLAPAAALAAPSEAAPLNVTAIVMFFAFVGATLGITYWAAGRTKTANDFFAAGGGISGFRNGLAIAGDYMSAATLLGACRWFTAAATTACSTSSASSSAGRCYCS
jgi:cation/acetate symporter